ncbi:MAG: polysaccharide biosynthesis/export family protein [Paludibacteraceae bacterium]|nr:polysaccharide biosynthesis/export family protein [Paludibacteraceae bacterium]
MRNNSRIFILLLMAAVVLTGCYSNRQIGLLQERKGIPEYDSVPYEPYRLHVNDQIVYRLITMDETISKAMMADQSYTTQYATTYRIYPDGTVDLPFLPPVKLEGLTEREAQDTLCAYFRQIIPDADVKMSLYNKNFTVLGDLGSGQYKIYKERMTIFQALAMTGDVQNSGDRKHVRIVRPNGNEPPEVLEFDIRSKSIIDSKYYYIYPNDLIYVSREKGAFYKVPSYSGFIALVTSSISLLVTVLNYIPNVNF